MNPFKQTDKEWKEFQEVEQRVKDNLQQLQRVAQDILLDERYKGFANIIRDAENNTVALLLRYKEDDPNKFKAKVDEFLIELRVYRNMLNSINDLANPAKRGNPNFSQQFKDKMKGLLDNIR